MIHLTNHTSNINNLPQLCFSFELWYAEEAIRDIYSSIRPCNLNMEGETEVQDELPMVMMLVEQPTVTVR